MKMLALLFCLFFCQISLAQKKVSVGFENDYKDVYHLSLIIYIPDGKNQTRVSNLQPGERKKYQFPVGTEIFIADRKQEAFAMKGNDIKATGIRPTITIKDSETNLTILLSSLPKPAASENPK